MTPKLLEQSFNRHAALCEEFAADEFRRKVLPWLKKRGCTRFIVGMGAQVVTDAKDDIIHDLPKRIQDVLDIEVPGFPNHSLGDFMPEYKAEQGETP